MQFLAHGWYNELTTPQNFWRELAKYFIIPQKTGWCQYRLSELFFIFNKTCVSRGTYTWHGFCMVQEACQNRLLGILYSLSPVIPFIAFFIPFIGKQCTNKTIMLLCTQVVRNTANNQASGARRPLATRATAYAMQKTVLSIAIK